MNVKRATAIAAVSVISITGCAVPAIRAGQASGPAAANIELDHGEAKGKRERAKRKGVACSQNQMEVTATSVTVACTFDKSRREEQVAVAKARERILDDYGQAIMHQENTPEVRAYIESIRKEPQPRRAQLGNDLIEINHLVALCLFDDANPPDLTRSPATTFIMECDQDLQASAAGH